MLVHFPDQDAFILVKYLDHKLTVFFLDNQLRVTLFTNTRLGFATGEGLAAKDQIPIALKSDFWSRALSSKATKLAIVGSQLGP
jgi:hypothetical protein